MGKAPNNLIRISIGRTGLVNFKQKNILENTDNKMSHILKELFNPAKKKISRTVTEEEYLQAVWTVITFECENNIETWRIIPQLNGNYKASNLGRIKSCHFNSPHHLKPVIKGKNLFINIALGKGKTKQYRLDYLIIDTFLTNPTNSTKVIHYDNNPVNCNLLNLGWK